jgi:uncharacterized membrane protein YhiD involved in acid resistance
MELLSTVSGVDNQSVYLIVFSLLLAFLLSALIVFTYDKVSQEVIRPDHFLQSLILMSIVTAIIMQSIGDSLARGFGIFGALAILRFRTNISSPRNIAFIFAAMAVGIACGVYSFLTAIIGTLMFCLIAFFIRLTPFSRTNNMRGQLRMELPATVDQANLQQLLHQWSSRCILKRYRLLDPAPEGDFIEYTYELYMEEESRGIQLLQALRQMEGARAIRLVFNDTYVNQYD